MLFENIKLAFRAMKANKLRTMLSLLGIVIGVGSVVAILSLGESANQSITGSLTEGGLEMITLYPTRDARTTGTFTEEFGDQLIDQVANIKTVIPMQMNGFNVRNGQEVEHVQVAGVVSTYPDVMEYKLSYGSWFSAMDNINKRQVCVLGSDIAETLFPDGGAIGSFIKIFRNQAKSYQVVGVMDAKDASYTISYNDTIYIPYNTYQQRLQRSTSVSQYVIRITSGANPITVSNNLESYLDGLVGTDAYTVFSPATIAEMSASIMSTFSTFLAAIGGISLLVGGIGIMNIMLVSVAERTREIGIRKALGASPRVIRGQFITEAVTLTLIGGALGIIFGVIVTYAATHMLDWGLYLSYTSFILAAGFSMVVGVFFGWYPAKKAASLDPIEALNYE